MARKDIRDTLTGKGIKFTEQRKRVLSLLQSVQYPLTAREIFFQSGEYSDSISLATVYRTLEMFANKGIASKTFIDSGKTAKYEINDDIHKHHLICTSCKKILIIEGCPIEEYEKKLVSKTGFEITEHKLNLYGFCPECSPSVNRN